MKSRTLYRPVLFALFVVVLCCIPFGCERPEETAFRKRVDNTVSYFQGSVNDPIDRVRFPRLLNDLRTKPLHVGMAPILSSAIVETRGGKFVLWTFWIEDQPTVANVLINSQGRELAVAIPAECVDTNARTKDEYINYYSKVKFDADSDLGKLIFSTVNPATIRVSLFTPKSGASNSVSLVVPRDNDGKP